MNMRGKEVRFKLRTDHFIAAGKRLLTLLLLALLLLIEQVLLILPLMLMLMLMLILMLILLKTLTIRQHSIYDAPLYHRQ